MKCSEFKWNLKQSCEIILFQKSKSILLGQQDYFAKLSSEFFWANKWFIGLIKKISLPQQKHSVRPTKQFCYTNRTFLLLQQNSFVGLTKRANKKILLAQQNSFVAQITTKLFCCGNKILVGQTKPFSLCNIWKNSIIKIINL